MKTMQAILIGVVLCALAIGCDPAARKAAEDKEKKGLDDIRAKVDSAKAAADKAAEEAKATAEKAAEETKAAVGKVEEAAKGVKDAAEDAAKQAEDAAKKAKEALEPK